MFSQESKVAVLESKLSIYEELSREMLTKLESAVEKISESNSRIANILTKHDERIEQAIKTDDVIVRMIEEVKENNSKEHRIVAERIEKVENTISELSKFKWQVVAISGVSVVIIGFVVPFIDNMMPSPYNGGSQTTQVK
jgi:FtsZ-binding cell division protein ZapB